MKTIEHDEFCVYIHEIPDGRKYIGMTQQNPNIRFHNGEGYSFNKPFYDEIKKVGWENIKHYIVKDGLSLQEAAQLEIELIQDYDATNPKNGFNRDNGGSGHGNPRKCKTRGAALRIGENIRKLREMRGISTTELAECAGIAQPQIAKYESGITVPNAISAVAIAKRLGTTVERLVEGGDMN